MRANLYEDKLLGNEWLCCCTRLQKDYEALMEMKILNLFFKKIAEGDVWKTYFLKYRETQKTSILTRQEPLFSVLLKCFYIVVHISMR